VQTENNVLGLIFMLIAIKGKYSIVYIYIKSSFDHRNKSHFKIYSDLNYSFKLELYFPILQFSVFSIK